MACKCAVMANTLEQNQDKLSGAQGGRNEIQHEIRKPKAEIRKKSEIRTPNDGIAHAYSAFGFRTSDFGLLSDFGLREAIAKLTTFGYSHAPFPLTPALSLRER